MGTAPHPFSLHRSDSPFTHARTHARRIDFITVDFSSSFHRGVNACACARDRFDNNGNNNDIRARRATATRSVSEARPTHGGEAAWTIVRAPLRLREEDGVWLAVLAAPNRTRYRRGKETGYIVAPLKTFCILIKLANHRRNHQESELRKNTNQKESSKGSTETSIPK